jgi:two-component system OmpR family response regulator
VEEKACLSPGMARMAAPMTQPPSILVVDDDPQIREVVRFALARDGYGVVEAGNGVEALAAVDRAVPALVVLDIVMPEMDGTEVCRALRARSRVPIIFLSSRDDEVDRIVGLELGGDDYVTKPFSPRELVSRVRAVLRRASGGPPDRGEGQGRLRHGRLEIDLDRFQALWDGREVVLTVTEFGLVRAMMAYPGKVYSREELRVRAYPDETFVSGRTIDSHIRRVRQKFAAVGGSPVETVHGAGYKVGDCG